MPVGCVVILGPNGSGKTNLLEALTVLGNLVSFRPGTPAAWVRRGESHCALHGRVRRDNEPLEIGQTIRLAPRSSRGLTRGSRRVGSQEYLGLFPVVALSSSDRRLVWDGPEERRRFLDRLSFHLRPETLDVLQRYRTALRQRTALLHSGGDEALAGFEHTLATLGAHLVRLRWQALAALEAALDHELGALGWSLPRPRMRYHAHDNMAADDEAALAQQLRQTLARSRRNDRLRGRTTVGPHRHDLALTMQGVPARDALSAGQGKFLAMALRLAAMAVISAGGRVQPAVVFDDVDAELDTGVLERVLARLAEAGQVFLSSAHEEVLLPRVAPAAVWRLCDGQVQG